MRFVEGTLARVETGFCPDDIMGGEGTQPRCERQDFAAEKRQRRPGREILALTAWLRAFTTHDVVWAKTRFDARKGALDETRG